MLCNKITVSSVLFSVFAVVTLSITQQSEAMEIQTINPEIKQHIFFTCDKSSQSNWKFVCKNFYTFYTETRNKQKKYICDLIELCKNDKNDDLFDLSEFTRYATTQGLCGLYTRRSICSCFNLADTIQNNKAIYHNITKIVPFALPNAISRKSPFALYLCIKQNSNDLLINKCPAIIEATRYEFSAGILQLLSMGQSIDATTEYGTTALIYTAKYGQLQIGKLLIDMGANAETITSEGNTALIWAVMHDKLQMVKLLIAAGADVDATTNYGSTALVWAASNGNTQIIKILIAANANVNLTDSFCRTALTLATGKHKDEIRKLLIDAGAK